MRSKIRNFRRGALAAAVALAAVAWHAALGLNVSRADDALRNDATAHVIAAFARGRGIHGGEVLWGETTLIDGAMVGTWSIVSRQNGQILAVGATIPLSLSENQPQQPGPFPRGAIASLDFPTIAQETTYFNHLEIHTEPNGHIIAPIAVDPNRFRPAHFDFHFYAVPEAQVWMIPGREPPGLPPVPAERLPAGYAQPGRGEPQMGRHAVVLDELTTHGPFSATMVAGFLPDASEMHFIEPMITRDKLLEAADFALPMPMPQTFDFDALYPTRFEAVFQGEAHYFIFSDFIDTNPATPASAGGLALGVAVPEPSTFVLSGLALLTLVVSRRKHTGFAPTGPA
jgi:hypothetical protein